MNIECSKKISYFNFALTIGIVMGHTTNYEVYTLPQFGGVGYVLLYIERFILTFLGGGVPSFFILSGYLFFRQFDIQMLPIKWKNRFFSLVIPYIFWCFYGFCFWELLYHLPFLGGAINSFDELGLGTIKGIPLCDILEAKYNGTLWFVQSLIIIVIMAPIIYVLLYNKYIGIIGLLIIALLVKFKVDINWMIPVTLSNIWFFSIGGLLGRHYKEIVEKPFKKPMIVSFLPILAIVLGLLYWNKFIMDNNGIDQVASLFIMALKTALMWIVLDYFDWKQISAPQGIVGMSFFIYVTHSLILESIEKCVLILLGNTWYGAWLDYLIAPFATLTLIYAFARIIQLCPAFWRIITGNRMGNQCEKKEFT